MLKMVESLGQGCSAQCWSHRVPGFTGAPMEPGSWVLTGSLSSQEGSRSHGGQLVRGCAGACQEFSGETGFGKCCGELGMWVPRSPLGI